jgi:hypothetical protein
MVAAAMPLPLQSLALLLREDGGQATGRAVLFASVVGFDVVENRVVDLAVATGIPKQRLLEIVDVGRQALSSASPTVREQHLVSKVLLRQFCESTPQGERLRSYSLKFGKGQLKAPRGVGKMDNFVTIDSKETERVWSLTEQNLPAALSAARSSRLFKYPERVTTIKDAIALHFARSLDALASSEALQEETLKSQRGAFLADKRGMDALFYLKYKFYPPAGGNAREAVVDDLLSTTRGLIDNGAYFRLRVVDLFHSAREVAQRRGLQIISPRRGEFLIGDVPAIPVDRERGAVGVLDGVAFADASMIVLPLGPRRLAALTKEPNGFERIGERRVAELNSFQVVNAKERVFSRPGGDLESFIQSQRPLTSGLSG